MGEAENLFGWRPNKQIKDMQVYWEWKNFQEKVILEYSKWENKWLGICGLNLGLSANKN